MRATETAHWLEWQDWADPVVKEPFAVRDGKIEIPERPGAGIEWNEAAVKRYAVQERNAEDSSQQPNSTNTATD